jgi:hypothetical protein
VTALAFSLAFAVLVFGALAWRWMSLNYDTDTTVDLDPVRIQEAISDLDTRIGEHDSKLNALMLERGLRTSKESRA